MTKIKLILILLAIFSLISITLVLALDYTENILSAKRFTSSAADEYRPSVSPDGTKILYYNSTDTGIWIINSDGSGQKKLVDGASWAAWRPNGQISYVIGNRLYIYRESGPGTLIYEHTAGGSPNLIIRTHEWSPSGDKIIFCGSAPARPGKDIIWTVNSDGTNPKILYEPADPNAASYPTWSSDGRKAAFTSRGDVAGAPYNIYIINSDSSGLFKVTINGGIDPDWSSLGVLFENDGQLWRIDESGSNLTKLTDAKERSFMGRWSPKTGRIYFSRAESIGNGGRNIWEAIYPIIETSPKNPNVSLMHMWDVKFTDIKYNNISTFEDGEIDILNLNRGKNEIIIEAYNTGIFKINNVELLVDGIPGAKIDVNPKKVDISKNSSVTFTIIIEIPDSIPSGNYSLNFHLKGSFVSDMASLNIIL